MTAYISQNAFWGLLISAVEVYKRECFGLLIGYRDRRGPSGARGESQFAGPPGVAPGGPESRRRAARAGAFHDMYIVEHAIAFQTARRRHKGVVSNPRAHRRIDRFLRTVPHLSVIGDFHSHTMWGYSRAASNPSDTDLAGMVPESVYVIVSINDRLREVPWNYNDDGSLSGTTDDHYFRLTAYTITPAREQRRVPILCPYAIGFDRMPTLRAVR
jgi:proteasome lid subunit RPN8/RPN11